MIKNPSKVLEPIVSILLAFLTGSLVIILIGEQPFEIFKMMFSGAFGSAVNISNTLVKTTTLTLAGLSYAFAYRCGLINIGAEGQMYIGALMATLVVLFMPGPGVLVVIVALIAGFLGGAEGALWRQRGHHHGDAQLCGHVSGSVGCLRTHSGSQ